MTRQVRQDRARRSPLLGCPQGHRRVSFDEAIGNSRCPECDASYVVLGDAAFAAGRTALHAAPVCLAHRASMILTTRAIGDRNDMTAPARVCDGCADEIVRAVLAAGKAS